MIFALGGTRVQRTLRTELTISAAVSTLLVVSLGCEPQNAPNAELGQIPSSLTVFEIDLNGIDVADLQIQLDDDPSSILVRSMLSDVYTHNEGYASLARFYSLSAAFLRNQPLPLARDSDGDDFVPCSMFSGSFEEAQAEASAATEALKKLVTMSRSGEFSTFQVVATADAAIEKHGANCSLLAEWSLATLRHYLGETQAIDPRREELALRLFVTLAEDGTFTSGRTGVAPAYLFLCEYFSAKQDPVSAFIAALTARDRLLSGSQTGFWDSENFSQTISAYIAALEPQAIQARRPDG